MEALKRLKSIFQPSMNSAKDRVQLALNVIEKYGFKAHYYLPSVGRRGTNDELTDALDALSAAGYIMTDKDGQIVGKGATARLSSDEKADMRRAEFRVIETGGQ